MSPELAFILILALRMAITAAFVVSASMVTERSGPVIGALIATLADFGRPVLRVSRARSRCGVHRRRRAGKPADQRGDNLPRACICRAGAAPQRVGQLRRRGCRMDRAGAIGRAGPLDVTRRLDRECRSPMRFACRCFERYRQVKMPLITRRWYDIPLRASLVATLVATVVTLSGWVGPRPSAA